MKPKLLKLSEIVTTAGTQIRASINADAVDQYAEAMQDAGNKFPPVVVFHDGSEYILADGFHRVMAATRNGFKDIDAEIHKGTKSDALKYALGANSTHGIPRTNSDKRRSVELALDAWPKLSDREISRICAVGAPLVGDVRNCNNITVDTRTGADGKTRKLPTRKVDKPANEGGVEGYAGKEWDGRVTAEEPPRVTIDAQWKTALGKKEVPQSEPDQPKLTPLQNMMVDLDYVIDQAVETLSAADLAKFKLHAEIGLRKLRPQPV